MERMERWAGEDQEEEEEKESLEESEEEAKSVVVEGDSSCLSRLWS